MIEIKEKRKIYSSFPIIESTREHVLFIDEPIVTIGSNSHGTPVLAILVDKKDNLRRDLRAITSEVALTDYFLGKTSLLDLLNQQEILYLVEKNELKDSVELVYEVFLKDVPPNYFPDKDSFYPYINEPLEYSQYQLGLHGGMADRHLIRPRDSAELEIQFAYALKSIVGWLGLGNIVPLKLIDTPGSYNLNFMISFEDEAGQIGLSDVDTASTKDLINMVLRYSWADLLGEVNQFMENPDSKPEVYQKICDKVESYLIHRGEKVEKTEIDAIVMKLMYTIITTNFKIAQVLSKGYDYIAIEAVDGLAAKNGRSLSIAHLDGSLKLRVENAKTIFDRHLKTRDIEKEKYTIEIYHLNVETGKGWAKVKMNKGGREIVDRARISISKRVQIKNSIYTQSLAEYQFIEVLGRATRLRDRIIKIYITE